MKRGILGTILPIALLLAIPACSLPGKTHYYISSVHDLPAGSIIKDSDIMAAKAESFRLLILGYRLPPEEPEFTEDRSMVVGHKVLQHIKPGYIIHLACINQ